MSAIKLPPARSLMPWLMIWAVAFSGVICGTTPAKSADVVVYHNDFESGVGSGPDIPGFDSGEIQTSPNGQNFLGFFSGGGGTHLFIDPLPQDTTQVHLTFKLYAINSLDGNGEFCCGPDSFQLSYNSDNVLFNHTFSNVVLGPFPFEKSQDYPTPGSPGKTGASVDTLGYSGDNGGDATYSLQFDVPTILDHIIFTFTGATDQEWPDEGFGIDDVNVTATTDPIRRAKIKQVEDRRMLVAQAKACHDDPSSCQTLSTLSAPMAPVPLPGSIWLLGSGLFGLSLLGRKKHTRHPAL